MNWGFRGYSWEKQQQKGHGREKSTLASRKGQRVSEVGRKVMTSQWELRWRVIMMGAVGRAGKRGGRVGEGSSWTC